jgi:hypothetical protein
VHNKKGAKMNSKFKIVAVRQGLGRRVLWGVLSFSSSSAKGRLAKSIGEQCFQFRCRHEKITQEDFDNSYLKLVNNPDLVREAVVELNKELPEGAKKYEVVTFTKGEGNRLFGKLEEHKWSLSSIEACRGLNNDKKRKLIVLCRCFQKGRNLEIDRRVAANRLRPELCALFLNLGLFSLTPKARHPQVTAEFFLSGGASWLGKKLGTSHFLQRGLAYGGMLAGESLVRGKLKSAAVLFGLGTALVPRLTNLVTRRLYKADAVKSQNPLVVESLSIAFVWLIQAVI